MRIRSLIAAALALLVSAPAASALPLYVAAHQAAGRQVARPERFQAIVGYTDQCVSGIPCWVYVKGTRSADGSLPENWYMHVNGVRVRDTVFNLYVMDPRSAGWQNSVVRACPARCFIDGLGPSAVNRMKPKPALTQLQWVKRSVQVVEAAVAAGRRALPNSVGFEPVKMRVFLAAAGRGSTEAFTPTTAHTILRQGKLWVQERGRCDAKYRAYQRWRGRGDHFSCYLPPARPWNASWYG